RLSGQSSAPLVGFPGGRWPAARSRLSGFPAFRCQKPVMLEQYVKKILTSRVYDVAVETPLQPARQLSERLGNQILLKREDLQPVFSFKIRGAYNKVAQLSPQELARG